MDILTISNLLMALAASENRAAFALARTYPGGTKKFIQAMNDKAKYLGLRYTRFADSAGLRNGNVSTAEEMLSPHARRVDVVIVSYSYRLDAYSFQEEHLSGVRLLFEIDIPCWLSSVRKLSKIAGAFQ